MVTSFLDAAEASEIIFQASDIEWHNSLGVVEMYHVPLRRVFNAVRLDDNTVYPALIELRLAVKSINDTTGANGLVPSLLVYGRLPRSPGQKGAPTQEHRKSIFAVALVEASQAACE